MNQEIVNRLKTQAQLVKGSFNFLGLLEIACAIVVAVLANHIDKEFASHFLLFTIVVYLILAFVRLANTSNPIESLTDELDSKNQLTLEKQLSKRLKTISNVHVQMMKNLNVQTCKLDDGGEEQLCDTGISESLSELLNPLIIKTFILLDQEKEAKYSYGLYLKGYRSLTSATNEEGIVKIKDQLDLKHLFEKDLFSKPGLTGDQLDFQTALKTSYNNKMFCTKGINVSGTDYTLTCSPMYEACREDDDSSILLGVLFIVSNELESPPEDLETQLKIFNRITANWIYSYNVCVGNKKR